MLMRVVFSYGFTKVMLNYRISSNNYYKKSIYFCL